SKDTDNLGVSAHTAQFNLPALVSGTPALGNVMYRQALYYRIDVTAQQAGQTLLLRFGTGDTTAANELYVRRGTLPTRQVYDLRSQQSLQSNQWLILNNMQAGTYYVLALAAPDQDRIGSLGTFSVQADVLSTGEFRVFDSQFGQGGTAGNR